MSVTKTETVLLKVRYDIAEALDSKCMADCLHVLSSIDVLRYEQGSKKQGSEAPCALGIYSWVACVVFIPKPNWYHTPAS